MTNDHKEWIKRDRVVCKDGFTLSIQASEFHYCYPKMNGKDTIYTSVEVGMPSDYEPLLKAYVQSPHTDVMLKYLIFKSVPSTSPLYGEKGLKTNKKIRVIGFGQASNSHKACLEVSKKHNINYDELSACAIEFDREGSMLMESIKEIKPAQHKFVNSRSKKYKKPMMERIHLEEGEEV